MNRFREMEIYKKQEPGLVNVKPVWVYYLATGAYTLPQGVGRKERVISLNVCVSKRWFSSP